MCNLTKKKKQFSAYFKNIGILSIRQRQKNYIIISYQMSENTEQDIGVQSQPIQNQAQETVSELQQFPQSQPPENQFNEGQIMYMDEQIPYQQLPYQQPQQDIGNYQIKRSQSAPNAQYDVAQLMSRIIRQTQKVNDQTKMGFDWSLLLYCSCGWREDVWRNLFLSVDEKTKIPDNKHKTFINYTQQFMGNYGKMGLSQCMICGGEDSQILRNICGHQFCIQCWRSHVLARYTTYFEDPFPPCMQQNCPVKTSFKILQILSKNYPEVQSKFSSVLYKNYGNYSKSVKLCKGRPKISCNRCFSVDKMLGIIECTNCGNFVCPRCGDQAHGSTQCYHRNNWRKLVENQTQFIEHLGYRICPYCKEAVQRKQGCNSLVCKCKQQFCFVCGEKWLPNHSQHGDTTCYRYKEIMALKQQKKKQQQDGMVYYVKIQQRKSKLDAIQKRFQLVDNWKRQQLPHVINTLYEKLKFYSSTLKCLKEYCSLLQRSLCVLWGQILSLHFKQDQRVQFVCSTLNLKAIQIQNFLFQSVNKMAIALNKQKSQLTKKQMALVTEEGIKYFQEDYAKKQSQYKAMDQKIQEIIDSLDKFYDND